MQNLKRAVIYSRVSKDDGSQSTKNQFDPLAKWIKTLGYDLTDTYPDERSGGTADRPEFRRMMADARLGKFDLIVVWSMDRFSREGILASMKYIDELKKYNVAIKSLQEPLIDTTQDGAGDLILAVMSWLAHQERKRISERTKAGLAQAKKRNGGILRTRGKDLKPRKRLGYILRYSS